MSDDIKPYVYAIELEDSVDWTFDPENDTNSLDLMTNHDGKLVPLYDQATVESLQAKIAELQGELAYQKKGAFDRIVDQGVRIKDLEAMLREIVDNTAPEPLGMAVLVAKSVIDKAIGML